jgi:hypothetical protein
MADDPTEPDVYLRLRVQQIPGWPVATRLKLLLKTLLRTYGLRNVGLWYEQPPAGTPRMPQDARSAGRVTGGPP